MVHSGESNVFPRLKAALEQTPPSYKRRMLTWHQWNRCHPRLVAAFNFIHDMLDVDTRKITMQACQLTYAHSAISEATSQLARENDSSSDTEDPFASADEDEGELEDNKIVLEDDCKLRVLDQTGCMHIHIWPCT